MKFIARRRWTFGLAAVLVAACLGNFPLNPQGLWQKLKQRMKQAEEQAKQQQGQSQPQPGRAAEATHRMVFGEAKDPLWVGTQGEIGMG